MKNLKKLLTSTYCCNIVLSLVVTASDLKYFHSACKHLSVCI